VLSNIIETDIDDLAQLVGSSIRYSTDESEQTTQFLIDETIQSFSVWWENNSCGFQSKYSIEGEIVGFIIVKNFWNLSHLFVLPNYQRFGIGRALVQSAIDACKERSPEKKLKLNSSTYAADFYKCVGFRQSGPSLERPGGCIPYEYSY